MVSHYIYIYIYMVQNLIGFRLFGFCTQYLTCKKKKKKNLDENMAKNWTSIEIKFRIELNLDSSIFTLNNSFDIKLKIK